jgi:hypothetical protein
MTLGGHRFTLRDDQKSDRNRLAELFAARPGPAEVEQRTEGAHAYPIAINEAWTAMPTPTSCWARWTLLDRMVESERTYAAERVADIQSSATTTQRTIGLSVSRGWLRSRPGYGCAGTRADRAKCQSRRRIHARGNTVLVEIRSRDEMGQRAHACDMTAYPMDVTMAGRGGWHQ